LVVVIQLEEAGPLILLGEGDWDLAISQRFLYGRLEKKDLAQSQLLRTLRGEAAFSAKDDVDNILWILEIFGP
jgi:hypothetical protein